MPLPSIVAIAVLLLLQLPPVTVSLNVNVPEGHIAAVPDMIPAAGTVITFMVAVATAVPQLLVTE